MKTFLMMVRFQISNHMKRRSSMMLEGKTESARSVNKITVSNQILKGSRLVSSGFPIFSQTKKEEPLLMMTFRFQC